MYNQYKTKWIRIRFMAFRFKDGLPSGLSWFSLEGGGWLVGELDQEGIYNGEAAYLYPDLSTAIVGVFEEGRLMAGRIR